MDKLPATLPDVAAVLVAALDASVLQPLLDQPHEDGEEVGPRLREGAPRRCCPSPSHNSQFCKHAAHPAPPRPRAAERLQRPQGVREGRGAPVLRREVGPPRAVREQLLDLGRQEGQVRLGTYVDSG